MRQNLNAGSSQRTANQETRFDRNATKTKKASLVIPSLVRERASFLHESIIMRDTLSIHSGGGKTRY